MHIEMVGIDHDHAPVEKREVFAFTRKAAAACMEELKEYKEIEGCVLISTCNRLELYVSSQEEESHLLEKLCGLKQVRQEAYEDCFVCRRDSDAIRHLFFLTSGMKSRIFGEDQILSQVKDALALSREHYCTDKVLEVLFRMAVTAAKKVKSEVPMHKGNYSAFHEVVEALRKQGYSFSDKKCLVIGNGEMGKITANLLLEEKADVTVTVRQYKSGVVMIPDGAKRMNYGDRYQYMPKCDVVISATASPNVTVKRQNVAEFAGKKEQIYIDLAVPRDMEPEIASLPGVTLYDIDSFQIEEKSQEMQRQYEHARDIIEEAMQEYFSWQECRDLIPRIQNIGAAFSEELLWRMGGTLQNLTLEQEEEQRLKTDLERTAEKVLDKLLYQLRDQLEVSAFRDCLDALDHK